MFKSDHVAVYVSDLERARLFYASCFGAKVLSKPSSTFLELAIDGFRLHLLRPTRPSESPAAGGVAHFCLSVDSLAELQALADRLRESRLVRPETVVVRQAEALGADHVEERPPAYVLYFHDPDGTMIEVRCYG